LKPGRPSYFQKTEELLREYKYMETDIKNLQVEIERLKEDLIPNFSSDVIKMGKRDAQTPLDTSATERHGIMLAEHKGLKGLEWLLKDVRRQYESLREVRAILEKDELQFVWLRYDKEKSHTQTQMALAEMGACMSERSYFYFRQKVVNKIARYMGITGPYKNCSKFAVKDEI
jgi:hypothetical protein